MRAVIWSVTLLSALLTVFDSGAEFRTGFGRALITPELPDTWQDLNSNGVFEEEIDSYQDGNGNARFDPVWMAGFQKNRPAAGVHLPLESIAVVMDDGKHRIAIVSADVVGLMGSFVQRIRQQVPPTWNIDYLLVRRMLLAVEGAVEALEPARLQMTTIQHYPRGLSRGIYDRFLGQEISAPGHAKARAFGYSVADAVLHAVEAGSLFEDAAPRLGFQTASVSLPLNNYLLSLASLLGVIDSRASFRFRPPFMEYQSEVGLLRIGQAQLAAIPGELYPEIAVGGIEHPSGADYDVEPLEVPPLRTKMSGRVNLMVNLANDALGYIIPKSEWDKKAPWIYHYQEETYGEIVSLGPDTAPVIHRALLKLLDREAQ